MHARQLLFLIPVLLLAACFSSEDRGQGARTIDCHIPGQTGFKPICTMERSASPDGTVVTARVPDGEFRRFLIVKDGRGVVAADGAEEVKVAAAGPGGIDVTVNGITWRLPAKVTE